MKLTYEAFDQRGLPVRDMLEAVNAEEARQSLRRKGLFVTKIAAADAAPAARPRSAGRSGSGRNLKQLALFTRQMHVLVAGGTPLVQALAAVERQSKDPGWREALAGLRSRVEEGGSLSDAMTLRPDLFDPICRSLVTAGESSGKLAVMLDRLAALNRQKLRLRNALIGAMVYPSLLLFVGLCVMIGMLLFVLPRFEGLFHSLNVALSPTTQLLMGMSHFLINDWWLVILVVSGAAVAGWFFLTGEAGGRFIDTAMLRAPWVGGLTRNFLTAQLARVLGVLVESQVPLLESLRLTREGSRNMHYARLLSAAEETVTRGEPMSAALAKGDLISPSVCEAIRNGEQSGQVGRLLLHMADFLDEENEVVVRTLTSILEPVILIFLGIVVGAIALSMFLPLFDLAAMAKGGG